MALRSGVARLTLAQVEKLGDPELLDAVKAPDAHWYVRTIFDFLNAFSAHCIVPGAMGVVAIDRYKLDAMATERGLELDRFDALVNEWCHLMVTELNRQASSKSK